MTVTFENPLEDSEFYFAKEVFFEDTAEITEVIRKAREILGKYNLNFVRFRFRGELVFGSKGKRKGG